VKSRCAWLLARVELHGNPCRAPYLVKDDPPGRLDRQEAILDLVSASHQPLWSSLPFALGNFSSSLLSAAFFLAADGGPETNPARRHKHHHGEASEPLPCIPPTKTGPLSEEIGQAVAKLPTIALQPNDGALQPRGFRASAIRKPTRAGRSSVWFGRAAGTRGRVDAPLGGQRPPPRAHARGEKPQ